MSEDDGEYPQINIHMSEVMIREIDAAWTGRMAIDTDIHNRSSGVKWLICKGLDALKNELNGSEADRILNRQILDIAEEDNFVVKLVGVGGKK